MNENAARMDWAGLGVRLPRRLVAARPLRLAVERALGDDEMRARVRALAAWSATHDAAAHASRLIERLVGGETSPPASADARSEAPGAGLEPAT